MTESITRSRLRQARIGTRRTSAALIGTAIAIVILGVGLNAQSAQVITIAVAFMALVAIVVLWIDRRQAFPVLVFVICYCLFLLGRQTVNVFAGVPPDQLGVLGTDAATVESMNRVNVWLFLGLVGILAGWLVGRTGHEITESKRSSPDWMNAARSVSGWLLLLTTPVRLYVIWTESKSVAGGDFYDARLGFASSMPMRVLEALFHMSFFAYLASRPNRRGAFLSCLLYLFVATCSLATLVRFEFLLSVALVGMYLYFRQVQYGERWFTKWRILPVVLASPLMLLLLNELGSRRGRGPSTTSGAFAPALDFLRAQGVSVKVLVYSDELRATIPAEKYFSFGPIIEFLQRFGINLAGSPTGIPLTGQTEQRAVEGHQLAHLISYLIAPRDYLRGTGYGSSFVAELALDFGVVGIFVGAAVYGYFLTRARRGLAGSFGLAFVTLMLLKGAMSVPRSSFVQLIVDPFSVSSLAAIAVLLTIIQVVKLIRRWWARRKVKVGSTSQVLV